MTTSSAATDLPSTNERVLFEGKPVALDSLGRWILAVLTIGIAALVYWLRTVSSHVRLTNQRLVVRSGILTVRTESIELYRVNDIVVEEPLGERMLGYGRLILISSDRSEPRLVLRGLKGPAALADQLRACVEEQRRTRRVASFAQV
jgi:hypothetical protein